MNNDLMKDIIQWDIKSWSKVLTYWDNNINWKNIQNGLELGAEKGGLSLWLALKEKQMLCSDLNDVKIKSIPLHIRYNVVDYIEYQDIDATNIPYENNFDIIIFKSIIGGIGRKDNYKMQQKVFLEIYNALKPNGKLLFAENLSASLIHQLLRKKYIRWGETWRYVSIKEMNELLSVFSSYQIKTTGVLGAFGRNESQRNLLSKIDEFILNKVCPDNWNYICYGIAEK